MATGQALADACQMELEEVEVAATELLNRESQRAGPCPGRLEPQALPGQPDPAWGLQEDTYSSQV